MNREETKQRLTDHNEQAKVESHFACGGKVEVKAYGVNTKWYPCPSPRWKWDDEFYRIKPEPEYEPYTQEDMEQLLEEHDGVLWFRRKEYPITKMVTGVEQGLILLGSTVYRWDALLREWEHLDGTPAGKEVE